MSEISIPILNNPGSGHSLFTEQSFTLEDYHGMFISPRQEALNFRHRVSEPGYFSSWHVAGDPTLILIRRGTLRIGLRDGSFRDFSAGDAFIAQDRLPEGAPFDDEIHGHTAQVISEEQLLALHLKLATI